MRRIVRRTVRWWPVHVTVVIFIRLLDGVYSHLDYAITLKSRHPPQTTRCTDWKPGRALIAGRTASRAFCAATRDVLSSSADHFILHSLRILVPFSGYCFVQNCASRWCWFSTWRQCWILLRWRLQAFWGIETKELIVSEEAEGSALTCTKNTVDWVTPSHHSATSTCLILSPSNSTSFWRFDFYHFLVFSVSRFWRNRNTRFLEGLTFLWPEDTYLFPIRFDNQHSSTN